MFQRIIQVVTRNFWYKLLSLFLAILIWGLIQGEQVYEVNREIRVTVQVPEGFAIRGEERFNKAATIRGPRVWMLEAPEHLEADVVIPEGTLGHYRIRLDTGKIRNWNERLQLMIHDPFIEIFVDEAIERTIPVKEVLQGTPAEGYIVKQVRIDPLVTTVQGVRTDVLRIRQVVTEPIDISGLQESKTVEVKLVAPAGVRAEELGIDSVMVHLEVGDSKINKRFGNIPVEIIGGDYTATVRPNQVSIMVQGTPGVLNFVTPEDFRAFIEIQSMEPGRYELDIRVKIPSDTVMIETFPEKAIVHILDQKRDNDELRR